LLVVASILLLNRLGVHLQLGWVIPLVGIAIGGAVTYSQLDEVQRIGGSGAGGKLPSTKEILLRAALGAAIMISAIFMLVVRDTQAVVVARVLMGAVIALLGLGVVMAPWSLVAWRRFVDERDGRVREAERADLAAHLHDSVLQTLSLIQRNSEDGATVVRLARAQERDLRAMLYGPGRVGADGTQTVSGAAAAIVAEVEDHFGVPIELVVVGDHPVGEAAHALLAALREAVMNAVRHGAPPVQVYLECLPGEAEAFVRDRGPGFDPAEIEQDRLGVRESIIGRMTRHGGSADVRSTPGDGAEIRLRIPWPAE